MTVESNRILGCVSAVLLVFSAIASLMVILQMFYPASAFLGVTAPLALLSVVGFILLFVAMYGFSKDYKEPAIFNNMLYGFLTSIVAVGISMAVTMALIFANLEQIAQSLTPLTTQTVPMPAMYESIIGYVSYAFIAAAIATLIQMLFYSRAFSKLADKSRVQQFSKVGTILIVSGFVNIIVAALAALLALYDVISVMSSMYFSSVAAEVQIIAWIVAAKAYLAIKPPTQAEQSNQ